MQASTSQVRAAEPAGQGNDSQASTSQMRATDTANPEKGVETATSQQDQAAATGAANHQDGVAQDVGNAAAAVATAKPRHRTKGIARPRYSTTRAWTVRRPIETVSSDQAVSTTAAEAADGPSNHDVQPEEINPNRLPLLTNDAHKSETYPTSLRDGIQAQAARLGFAVVTKLSSSIAGTAASGCVFGGRYRCSRGAGFEMIRKRRERSAKTGCPYFIKRFDNSITNEAIKKHAWKFETVVSTHNHPSLEEPEKDLAVHRLVTLTPQVRTFVENELDNRTEDTDYHGEAR